MEGLRQKEVSRFHLQFPPDPLARLGGRSSAGRVKAPIGRCNFHASTYYRRRTWKAYLTSGERARSLSPFIPRDRAIADGLLSTGKAGVECEHSFHLVKVGTAPCRASLQSSRRSSSRSRHASQPRMSSVARRRSNRRKRYV